MQRWSAGVAVREVGRHGYGRLPPQYPKREYPEMRSHRDIS